MIKLKYNEKTGIILIDKPPGVTSHDVVERIRKITGIKKIGHSGTLDPFATGLLILGINRGTTKKINQLQKLDKEYIAKLKLGFYSDTFDKDGKVEEVKNYKITQIDEIKKVIKGFEGEILQMPPHYSAKKIKGKKAYELARKGIKFELKPINVKIFKIEILNYDFPNLEIKVNCSSGTYIRSLANDIGKKLSCGAILYELRRTKIGNFSVEYAQKLENLNQTNWQNFLIDFHF